MTNEEMFNQNKKLAYKIASQYLINYKNEYEDIKQIALLGLWKAILTFDNTHTFSTYAYTVIRNEINYYLRTNNKNMSMSINAELKDGFTLEDVLENDNNEIERLEQRLEMEKVRNIVNEEVAKLKQEEKDIYKYLIIGFTQQQIANKIGKSQAQVSRIRAKIIQKSKKRACL